MRLTGQEWLEFLDDEQVWSNEAWIDYVDFRINGTEADTDDPVKPTDLVSVLSGDYYPSSEMRQEGRSLVSVIRKWKAARTQFTCTVSVPSDKTEALLSFVKSIGGKTST